MLSSSLSSSSSAELGPLLGGIDRAAFVVALAQRLRGHGVPVTMTAMASLAEALAAAPPQRVRSLYWLARLTLVNRQHDLEIFDLVFGAAFGDAVLAVDPHARRRGTEPTGDAADSLT